jgi:hypothetical protein
LRSGSTLIVYALITATIDSGAERAFQRTTLAAILKTPERFDGTTVELHGRLVLGFERSSFTDLPRSPCSGPCALWVSFARCKPCIDSVKQATHGRAFSFSSPSIMPNVTLRGTVYTEHDPLLERIWPDLESGRRVEGFGHLGQYPGEIIIEQIVIGDAK